MSDGGDTNTKNNGGKPRSGNASVEVRSEQPVSEPFVDLVVEVRWPTGRLVRQYTLLLDLPPR